MSGAAASLYVDVAGRPWEERRPGVSWKVLWEQGHQKAVLVRYACTAGNYARRPPGCVHTVHSEPGALVLAIMSGATQPVPNEAHP